VALSSSGAPRDSETFWTPLVSTQASPNIFATRQSAASAVDAMVTETTIAKIQVCACRFIFLALVNAIPPARRFSENFKEHLGNTTNGAS
jgi:hypothetical protein